MTLTPIWRKANFAKAPATQREMVMRADWVLAFWDGKSKGTESSINQARRLGKHVEIVKL